MYFVCHHKCGIETETEMTDDLVVICLVLVFLNKVCGTGESNLVDVLFHFISRHTKTVIDDLNGLLCRIHKYLNLRLVILGQSILTHHI